MPSSRLSRQTVTLSAQVAGGLLIFAIAGYAFVAFTGLVLTPDQASLAINFYFLVNIVGPGIFVALEQVASRSTVRARAAGRPLGRELHRVRRAGAGLVAAVTALLLLLAPVLCGITLRGDWGLYCLVLATPAINAAAHLARGRLTGLRRFDRYAGMLAVEGTTRVVFCLPLLLAGTTSAWVFGAAYLAATLASLLVGTAWLRADSAADTKAGGPAGAPPPVGGSLTALAFATLFSQLLPNIAPLVVSSRSTPAVALAFGQAAVVARLPLLLLFPLSAVLLPQLTAAVARGEIGFLARRIRLVLTVVIGLGTGWAAVFVLLGPLALQLLLDTPVDVGSSTMMLLAGSIVALGAAFAVQPALLALGRDRVVTGGWVVGSMVTFGFAALMADPVRAASVGQVVGAGLTFLVYLLGSRAGLRATAATRPA